MNILESALFSPLSIAPMIDWSDTHFRMLMRILAPRALVYTEMQTPNAIQHQPSRTLQFHPAETPVALQLGGSDPKALAEAARKGEAAGFSEINLNLGCPSSRVLAGCFGASLMKEPKQVTSCIIAMKQAVSIPVTTKIRIGIDHENSYEFFEAFVHALIEAGSDKLIVHARCAWLKGLNPKQNRTIPPLHYEYVHRIKPTLPKHIPVVINGEINTLDKVKEQLTLLDGVMIGRLACNHPYAIAEIHHAIYPTIPKPTRAEILRNYLSYAASQNAPKHCLIKPILNLVHGLPHAKHFKQAFLQFDNFKNPSLFDALCRELYEIEHGLNSFSKLILVN